MTESIQQADDADIRARLISLIDNMSVTERRDLLNMLEDLSDGFRRNHPRKACDLAVDCVSSDRVFKDFMRNISVGGTFIETRIPFSMGEEMTMTFAPANSEDRIKVTGEIVWTGRLGIGVKFETANKELELLIRSL